MPLGSGALASTTYPIDRDFVRQQLGFARVTNNSLDGVSDRDYCVELTAALSILMMHLSRFSEEIISWCSWEFKFVELMMHSPPVLPLCPRRKIRMYASWSAARQDVSTAIYLLFLQC